MFLCHLILSKLLLIFIYCCCPVSQSCLTLCNPMDCSVSDFLVLHHLPELVQTHVPWVSGAMQPSLLCHPLSFCLQSLLASGSFPMSWLFTSGGQILELQLQHQSFQQIFRLISFRIDWFDFLAVQGTLKSLLQYHSSKASFLMYVVVIYISLPWRSGLL